jgi:hypothetical protein
MLLLYVQTDCAVSYDRMSHRLGNPKNCSQFGRRKDEITSPIADSLVGIQQNVNPDTERCYCEGMTSN